MVGCETQAEVDYFWGKLTQGGQEARAAGSRTSTDFVAGRAGRHTEE